jgi:hypothetical protein
MVLVGLTCPRFGSKKDKQIVLTNFNRIYVDREAGLRVTSEGKT